MLIIALRYLSRFCSARLPVLFVLSSCLMLVVHDAGLLGHRIITIMPITPLPGSIVTVDTISTTIAIINGADFSVEIMPCVDAIDVILHYTKGYTISTCVPIHPTFPGPSLTGSVSCISKHVHVEICHNEQTTEVKSISFLQYHLGKEHF